MADLPYASPHLRLWDTYERLSEKLDVAVNTSSPQRDARIWRAVYALNDQRRVIEEAVRDAE